MLNLPTFISLSRIPLAFCFFFESSSIRLIAIVLALFSDGLDGYLARKHRQTTQFGALVDPITDKFFVIVALYVLVGEQYLTKGEALFLLCRDYAVALFALYLCYSRTLFKYHIQAIISGKLTTALQAGLLILLVWGISIPFAVYLIFPLLGIAAFIELWRSHECCLKSLN